MNNRIPLLGGLSLLTACILLAGCDPNKNGANTPPPAAPTSTSAGPTTAAPTSANSTSTAPASENKPAEIPGAPHYTVITNGISPFWDSMSIGLYQADKDAQVNGDWQAPMHARTEEQKKLMEDALASKTNGIAVSVIDADALVPIIDQAVSSGVPVITFDSDAPKSKRAFYIGTNNYDAGKAAGEAAIKLFPKGGKLIAFVGNLTADNAIQRYKGFEDAIQGHNITFIREPFQDNKDTSSARKNVEDAIGRYPEVNGLVGLYSYNGPAIVQAVQAANIRDKVKIICFDCEPQTVENLSKGLIDVTVVQKPYEFGRLSILLLNYLNKEKNDANKALGDLKPELDKLNMKVNGTNIDTGVDVITPANSAEFLQKLKEKGLKSS